MRWKPIQAVNYIVIHCSATRASDEDIDAQEIRRWHLKRGWFDIGYHYVILRNGEIEKGRPDNTPGAHARGYNHRSLGICLVGGVAADGIKPEDNFTIEQWQALESLVYELHAKHPAATVLGHRDLEGVSKMCPSFNVPEWWLTVQQ